MPTPSNSPSPALSISGSTGSAAKDFAEAGKSSTPPAEPKTTDDASDAHAKENRDELIRQAAYRRYQERGDRDGNDLDDWLAAEKDVDGTAVEP